MAERASRTARVQQLLAAARVLVDPTSSPGQRLRQRLLETTGLSTAGIELALTHCLEVQASADELTALLESTPEAERAHVALSGNVFVAALRAIALGVACSADVQVRASRRDPALAEALHAQAPELFRLVPELAPQPGDRYWCYGSDETLASVRCRLPAGVWFHGHGHGIGAVVVDPTCFGVPEARAVAFDTVLFDQHGCLSPRLVCVVGSEAAARHVARALAEQLQAWERAVPPGPPSAADLAAARRSRDAASYAFELFDAGSGWLSLSPNVVLPTASRCLHVMPALEPARALTALAPHLTCIASNAPAVDEQLRQTFPGARLVALGKMQRPPLDGPVDQRQLALGERLP